MADVRKGGKVVKKMRKLESASKMCICKQSHSKLEVQRGWKLLMKRQVCMASEDTIN